MTFLLLCQGFEVSSGSQERWAWLQVEGPGSASFLWLPAWLSGHHWSPLLRDLAFPPWLSLLTQQAVPRKQSSHCVKVIPPSLSLCFWGVLSKSGCRVYTEHHSLYVKWKDSPNGERGQERKLCVCIHLWHDGFPLPGSSLRINKASKGFYARTPFPTNSPGVIDNKRPGSSSCTAPFNQQDFPYWIFTEVALSSTPLKPPCMGP